MKKKVALITGITGQDGSYLAELLLSKKYKFISKSSYERLRLSGRKKVNEFKDGFLILLSIFTMFIFKK